MFAQNLSYQVLSRSVCTVLAVVVVASALALGHIGVKTLEENGRAVFATMRV